MRKPAIPHRPGFATRAVLLVCFIPYALAPVSATSNRVGAVPENGFVSASKYTNAFFGFSLPLPQDSALRELNLSFNKDASRHFLFGLQSQKVNSGFFGASAKLTVFTVTATQSSSASSDEARKAASGAKGRKVMRTEIGGREFWKSEFQEKVKEGRTWSVGFATALNGYVLRFNIESFDGKLTDQFRRSVEALTFFDPTNARDVAGPESRAYNPAASYITNANVVPSGRIPQLNPGSISGNTYKNEELGFQYEFPTGWVVNDKATQEKVTEAGHQFVWGNDPSAAREHEAAEQCARILLFVTEHPAGTKTEQLNPLIIVMAVDPACSAGAHFPKSIDDREAIQRIARQILLYFRQTPLASTGQAQVRSFTTVGRLVIEVTQSLTANVPGQSTPSNIFTSMELMEAKDYWVAWMFATGSEAALAELKNTKIFFRPSDPVQATQP